MGEDGMQREPAAAPTTRLGESPFREGADSGAGPGFELEPNGMVGSPVTGGLHFIWLIQLVGLSSMVVGALLGFVASALLGLEPAFVIVPSLIVALLLAWRVVVRATRHKVRLVVDRDSVTLVGKKKTLSLPRAGLEHTLECREWHSSRTTGHNRWTILTFRHGEQSFSVGTETLLAAPSGRTGQPQHIAKESTFRELAAALGIALPSDQERSA